MSSAIDNVSTAKLGLTRRSCSLVQIDEVEPKAIPSRAAVPLLQSPFEGISNGIRDNKPKRRKAQTIRTDMGFLSDIKTGRWMLVPSSALKLWLIPVVYHLVHTTLVHLEVISPATVNLARPLLFLSGRQADGRYPKEWSDILFVLHYIIFWSCIRQFMTIHVFRPLAIWLGVGKGKLDRFTEQAYGLFYWGIFGTSGIIVMSGLPIWWFRTEHFYLEYPHKLLPFGLKLIYLLQASYWLQQMILLVARIEKPRSDFKLLAAHHIVTLYLIIGSYCLYFSYFGLAVFITMDCSDIMFCLAKLTNYLSETASKPVFAAFIVVWTYCRHYLNIRMLWSLYKQFDLIPHGECEVFAPMQDKFCAPWLRYQIFIPLFLLQLMNLFWSFMIARILVRTLRNEALKDDRSDDEDEEEEDLGDQVECLDLGERGPMVNGEKGQGLEKILEGSTG